MASHTPRFVERKDGPVFLGHAAYSLSRQKTIATYYKEGRPALLTETTATSLLYAREGATIYFIFCALPRAWTT